MKKVTIEGEFIQLNQLLKKEDICQSGGEAKQLILSGQILINGEPATEIRKKIRPGDMVQVKGAKEILKVEAEESAL